MNALANFCFLTKDTNLNISDRLPEEYFPEIEKNHPGALVSQWIPMDPALWKIGNYSAFLEARKKLLAAEMNRRMEALLHGDTRWLAGAPAAVPIVPAMDGGITSEAEEQELEALNAWVEAQGLARGLLAYDYADPDTGEHRAIFDLAWPSGLQEELSQPVAVLLNQGNEPLAAASRAGFRSFTSTEAFRAYVQKEILALDEAA